MSLVLEVVRALTIVAGSGATAAAGLALLMAIGVATRLFLFTYVVCRLGTWP